MFRILVASLLVALSMESSSCSSKSQASSSIVGTWNEYRENSDDYLLSSWKFNDDGSGLFVVEGTTNTQRVSFTWEQTSASVITINMNGEYSTLELNNGLLIEDSAFGKQVFRKE